MSSSVNNEISRTPCLAIIPFCKQDSKQLIMEQKGKYTKSTPLMEPGPSTSQQFNIFLKQWFQLIDYESEQNPETLTSQFTFTAEYPESANNSNLLGTTILKQQTPAKQNNDGYLFRLFCEIQKQLSISSPPKNFSLPLSTNSIREWMHNPENAAQLNTITELKLSGANLKIFPPEISLFTNLQTLDLSFNPIKEIPDTILELPNLQSLNLFYNHIEKIPDTIFTHPKLQSLNLSNNAIKEIQAVISKNSPLKILDLSCNEIEKVPHTNFELPNLLWLYLYKNQIKEIQAVTSKSSQLKTFDLSDNQIEKIPDTIFELLNLTSLNLSDNPIKEIQDTIRDLTQLDTLDLNNTPILDSCSILDNDEFCEELLYHSKSSLSKLYQAVLQGKKHEEMQLLLTRLSEEERQNLFYNICIVARNPSDDPQWGEDHALDDAGRFLEAFRQMIDDSLKNLTKDQQNAVYGKIHELAGRPDTHGDSQWGENHATDNYPRLADAIDIAS